MTGSLSNMVLPERLLRVIGKAPDIIMPETRKELLDLAMGGESSLFEVA
jgi:hypothetical protein